MSTRIIPFLPAILCIIAEEAENLFSGRATAEETARRIQSRDSIYVGEQS